MYVVIDISHLINNYPLGRKGFSNWVSFHLEMILDIGVIFSTSLQEVPIVMEAGIARVIRTTKYYKDAGISINPNIV